MSRTVIDAGIAITWVVEENGTPEALALLNEGSLALTSSMLLGDYPMLRTIPLRYASTKSAAAAFPRNCFTSRAPGITQDTAG